MPNPYFSFKQFTVFHDKCAMKVGIDGVLLGSWAPVEETTEHILDIGTGTGLIALMLAQRCNATIEGIDLDKDACLQATENIRNSPWAGRIGLQHISLQEFAMSSKKRYDLIVSNPPYFVNSLKAPDLQRHIARHAETLTHEELILTGRNLLTETGRMCIILPVNEGLQCIAFAKQNAFYCSSAVKVFPKPGAIAKRLLLEFCKVPTICTESELVIESEARHHYSPEFSVLAKDFYLKL